MKAMLTLSAVLLIILGCSAKAPNKGDRKLRNKIEKDWKDYLQDYAKDDNGAEDEEDFDIDTILPNVGEPEEQNNGCPNTDEIDEMQASCTFTITNTMAAGDFMAAIIFTQDVYGVKVDRPFNVMLPRSLRGILGRRRGPTGAKIYRISSNAALSPQTITVNFKLFSRLDAPPSYSCQLETCTATL